jgi:hypothetical protein
MSRHRMNTLPLPNPGEKDQEKVNQQLMDCLKILQTWDSEKEKRIQELERKVG